jgi:hypothetical protein
LGYNTHIHGKCHRETPCVAILNKNVFLFFFYKITEQEGGTDPVSGGWLQAGGKRMWIKGVRG